MFWKRIVSMLVVLSFISQTLVVVDTDSYSSVVVEDSSILEELSEQDGARSSFENATLLKDLNPGDASSNPQSLFAHTDGNLYFSADNDTAAGGHSCWRSDGTEEGTYMVKDICTQYVGCDGIYSSLLSQSSYYWPISVNDEYILFPAQNVSSNIELWRSDGTENGTYMVKDINPAVNGNEKNSNPRHFNHIADNKVIFSASDGYYTHGYELWVTNGTEEGTQLLKDINPGSDDSDIWHIIEMDRRSTLQ